MLKEFRPSIAAFLLMMAMALTTTALSFFVWPVCDDLGIGRGSFTIYYSLMTAAGAFSTTFLGQHINRRGVRGILFVSGIWSGLGLVAFSFAENIWLFYLVGTFIGFFGTSCMSLCANVIVQQSYSGARASSLLGVVMSGSGVGGMIVSLILPGIIESRGWQFGYRCVGLCWMVLVLSAGLILGKQETSQAVGHRKTPVDGMTRAEALRSPKLYLLMAAIFLLCCGCGIQQQIPALLADMGFETSQVSAMVSFLTAMLAVGKIVQGLIYGRIGVVKGSYLMVGIFAASFLMLLVPAVVYPALVALAFGMGVVTTLMPMIARFAFGAREYAAIWSILATASNVGAFVAAPVWGMVYDVSGSYTPALLASAALMMVALGAMVLSFREKRKPIRIGRCS